MGGQHIRLALCSRAPDRRFTITSGNESGDVKAACPGAAALAAISGPVQSAQPSRLEHDSREIPEPVSGNSPNRARYMCAKK